MKNRQEERKAEEESRRDNWAKEAGRRRSGLGGRFRGGKRAGRVRNAFNFLTAALAMQTNVCL